MLKVFSWSDGSACVAITNVFFSKFSDPLHAYAYACVCVRTCDFVQYIKTSQPQFVNIIQNIEKYIST